MKRHTCFLSSTWWSVSPLSEQFPFIRHHFSLAPAVSVPCTLSTRSRWWQVIRYLQAGSRARWKRARWALLSTTEQNHPQACRVSSLREIEEHGLESHLQLTNYPISRTPPFLPFRAGEKYPKLSWLIIAFLLSLSFKRIFGIFGIFDR